MKVAEHRIKYAVGVRGYVDTSQRLQYASMRAFYERCGYQLLSLLPDFYAQNNGNVIYCMQLGRK